MVEIDLLDIFKQFLKRWYIILVGMLICGGIGFAASKILPKQYTASSKVYIRGSSSITASLADLQIGSYLSNDYEVIFKSRPVLEKTINKLQLEMTTAQLNEIVTANTISDTRILSVSCKTNDPKMSRDIVNTLVGYAIDKVNEIDAKQPYIIEKAIAPANPSSLSPLKISIVGIAAGALLACMYIAIAYIFNDKISSSADIEKLGIVVLGQIYEDDGFARISESAPQKKEKKEAKKDA